MIDKVISVVFGTKHERDIKKLRPLVHRINSLEGDMQKLSGEEMRNKTLEFRERFSKGETLEDLLVEAFALVREASVRTLGLRHFDVQLIGGVVLHQGRIAEMKTGEGKTLVATLPVYLNALTGKGVHVVTVNDYLARRDSEWMAPVYEFLGMTVGSIQAGMDPFERQKAYGCDVTYGTNNEFGFDYLRDNMVEHRSLRVLRDLHFAIIDEVDSILIDEARTPLIISGSVEESTKKYYLINKIIPNLKPEVDYEVNEKDRHVTLTEDGIEHVQKLLKIDNLYDNKHIDTLHHLNQALKAHALFQRDVDYVVKDNQVVIVDEFTGRLMEGRRYSDGLHQAIEAKENVTVARESQTLASITFQNFFRMYDKLSGMTGTADTEAMEFRKIYNLDVVVIPTNRPMVRKDHPDRVYRTEREKFNAIVEDIRERVSKGQPSLVGTISIERSEKLSQLLSSKGAIHNVLNAKYHQKEAQIVAEAGQPGSVTIATNMAGRGTDIVLGGRKTFIDELEEHVPVHDVNKWEEFSARIKVHDFDRAEEIMEEMTGQDQNRAKSIVRGGREWLVNHQKVLDAGGLYILGTERHESRRIDNQLRGRSARQGDPGESRFYLSLEDDLMRLFSPERISGVMNRLGMEEGQEIESKMVSNAIASAQRRVEGRNFDIRKHLLEYDDVMNSQREFIYDERNALLDGEDVSGKIRSYIDDIVENEIEIVTMGSGHPEEWNIDELQYWMNSRFGLDVDFGGEINPYELSYREFVDALKEKMQRNYDKREEEIGTENIRTVERLISLQVIDNKWRDHLFSMDELRDGIWTLGYGERNPLTEYKIQGFALFRDMLAALKEEIVEYLFKVQVDTVVEEEEPVEARQIGNEVYADFEQFAQGGIPVGAASMGQGQKSNKAASEAQHGGVKRKKTRRSRR